jgi:predicted dithiol-disulfide oxidoreductase (DUF899 family)
MKNHPIVSPDEWLAARLRLLAKEKEFTRQRDQLSEERRALPWVKVEKEYVFDGPNGRETLPQLFQGNSQLLIGPLPPLRRHNTELGHMRPQGI